MSLLYTPPPQPAAPAVPHWQLPAAMAAQAWPLTPDEQDWLAQSGVKAAERWRFTWQGQTGSILLVTSDTWRAHHRPERCFEVYGLSVEGSRTAMLAPDFPARLLTLGSRAADTRLSAAYWLQAPGKVTDDQAERIWSDFEPTRHNWVLITILYDSASDPDSDAARALYAAVRAAVALGLQGEEVP